MNSTADNALEAYRIMTTAQAIRLWMRAKIKPSKDMGISDLLRIAGEYINMYYPNDRNGQQQALKDLDAMVHRRERRLKEHG